jgi:hypothetical protein
VYFSTSGKPFRKITLGGIFALSVLLSGSAIPDFRLELIESGSRSMDQSSGRADEVFGDT